MAIWYFAYGSNMQADTFRGRRGITWDRALPARVPGWRLTFDKPSLLPTGSTFANIVPDPTASVIGVAYFVTAEQLAHIELTEGVAIGNYKRAVVDAHPLDGSAALADVHTLTAEKAAPDRRPSTRYMGLVIAGALEHGLPADYLTWLKTIPTAEEGIAERAMRGVLDGALRQIRPQKKEPR